MGQQEIRSQKYERGVEMCSACSFCSDLAEWYVCVWGICPIVIVRRAPGYVQICCDRSEIVALQNSGCGRSVGPVTTLPGPRRTIFALSIAGPNPKWTSPSSTVYTRHLSPWVCGGSVVLAGHLLRRTYMPGFERSPAITADSTPGGAPGSAAYRIESPGTARPAFSSAGWISPSRPCSTPPAGSS